MLVNESRMKNSKYSGRCFQKIKMSYSASDVTPYFVNSSVIEKKIDEVSCKINIFRSKLIVSD